MISLLSVLTSGLINSNGDMVIPVCAGVILLGLVIGIINGLGIVVLRVHPLIVTLGMGRDSAGRGPALHAGTGRRRAGWLRLPRLWPRL